ncbi:MAG: Outer membrane porin protein 32 precursor [Candidatus Accumulibacter appositus]|uniref:Outer membrane porin protein 32 n=1 Tax=Candidatus Accumulibacter appositus TaxID=1454003 RepID=A0A011QQM8_9PROT|nr:porin [Accumulibacter sp.]EXI81209.1 MAG: Outer membrane porin protein 32 precursor [Candidatus Accumulibacter appositus]HRF06115.1 porin [Accumulibacter sp.]
MQKKLIALAVAGLASGAALAQTNVTVYGVVDAGYLYSSGNQSKANGGGTNTFSGLSSGISAGNRIGFKGSEALGNGLKAVFTLEYGLDIDTNQGIGTGGLNARQQFVGLASDKLGTVALGRQYAPGFNASARNSALDATDLAIQSNLSVLSGMSITPNSPARFDNSVTYTSPNFSGFTVSAIYGFGEKDVTKSQDNGAKYGIGGNYANGPINVDLLYQGRQNVVIPGTSAGFVVMPVIPPTTPPSTTITGVPATPTDYTGKDINEWYLGGSYDFKVVKLFASYQELYTQTTKAVPGTFKGSTLWTLGVNAPVGPGTASLSYGNLSLDNTTMKDGESWGAGTMYSYPLSKRTSLYAAYSYFSNDKYSLPMQTQLAPITTAGSPGIGAVGESNYAIGAGMTHVF